MPRVGPFYIAFNEDDATARGLKSINDKLEGLMTVAQTTQQKIDAIEAALAGAAAGLSADIQALKDALNAANNGMTEAEVNAALAPLEARAQALADLDATTTQEPPAPV